MEPDGQGDSSCDDKFDFEQPLPTHHPARFLPTKYSASRKASSLANCVGILNQLRDGEVDSDFVERRKKIRADVRRHFVPGKGRSRDQKTTMLFMESGLRHRPWYTWYVVGVVDGLQDIWTKAKKGGKTEDTTFKLSSFKRRNRPARASWSVCTVP